MGTTFPSKTLQTILSEISFLSPKCGIFLVQQVDIIVLTVTVFCGIPELFFKTNRIFSNFMGHIQNKATLNQKNIEAIRS